MPLIHYNIPAFLLFVPDIPLLLYHTEETLNGKMTFYGGSLSCKKEDCTFDTSKCLTLCGNGVLDENLEQCDGEQLGGKTCTNLGAGILSFAGGVLRCDDYCHLDTSACYEPEATKTDSKKSTSCFSGETFIEVLNKGMVSMKHLSVGDKVFTGNNEFGTPLYQPVYSFGHLELDVPTEYIRIFHTKTGKKEPPIELSPSHLIFVAGAKDPIRADIVTTGDALVRVGAEAVLVTKVDKVLRKGAYLPLTPSGMIVVNGVAASTYVSIDDEAPDIVQQFGISQQNLFHWWLTPYRMTCMGLSSKVCQEDFAENGIIHWLNFGEKFAMYGQQQHWIIQKIGVTILSLFLLVFVASEAVFGPKYGLPGSLVIVLVVRYALKRSAKQE